MTVEQLTKQVKSLYADVQKRGRLLVEDRLRLGHLLAALREKFSVRNAKGEMVKGASGGTFCAHLQASGLNVATCYSYIALAEGKLDGAPKPRVAFWQQFNTRMKKADGPGKVALLKKAVAHIVKLYGVKARVSVEAK